MAHNRICFSNNRYSWKSSRAISTRISSCLLYLSRPKRRACRTYGCQYHCHWCFDYLLCSYVKGKFQKKKFHRSSFFLTTGLKSNQFLFGAGISIYKMQAVDNTTIIKPFVDDVNCIGSIFKICRSSSLIGWVNDTNLEASLLWCSVTLMLVTEYVGYDYKILPTILAIFVINIHCLLTRASGINIHKSSPTSRCHCYHCHRNV